MCKHIEIITYKLRDLSRSYTEIHFFIKYKIMRDFNTSGPNILKQHYTIIRENIIDRGIKLVNKERYFTIWAPRQTGKSTYFRLLAKELEKDGYKVAHINCESYKNASLDSFLYRIKSELKKYWNVEFSKETEIAKIFNLIAEIKNQKYVLIIDEVEGINKMYFNDFLHAIRDVYHSREQHSLKSVLLVGVSNITGIIQDNASPFNIADNLKMPYFTNQETMELFAQHENETGQLFEEKVKHKISEITANQPGLVNGFAYRLVDTNQEKKVINYNDYLKVEQWYLTRVIDKNISNVIKVAKQYREFVENLLFVNDIVKFSIDKPAIEALHTNGLITWDDDNNIKFWVPLYKKRLFNVFSPYTNGEGRNIAQHLFADDYLTIENKINFDKLIGDYKQHIKLRSFRPYREKDDKGKFKSIPEAAMIYSFETYISIFLNAIKGKSYREAQISLGNSDLIINVKGFEYFIETKKFYDYTNFKDGKEQIAYYCERAGITQGIYIVYINNTVKNKRIQEATEVINKVVVKTFLIRYDEKKEFGK